MLQLMLYYRRVSLAACGLTTFASVDPLPPDGYTFTSVTSLDCSASGQVSPATMDAATTDHSLPAEDPIPDFELQDFEADPVGAAGPIPSVYSATFSAETWADVPPATRALLLSTVAETRKSFRDEDASDRAREQALAVGESRAALAAAVAKEAADLQAAEDAVRARDILRRRLGSAERVVIAAAARAAKSCAAVLAEKRRAEDLEAAHAPPRDQPGSPRSSSDEISLGGPARPSPSSARPPPLIGFATAAPEITSPSYEAAPAFTSHAVGGSERRLVSEVKSSHSTPHGQPGFSPRSSSTATSLGQSSAGPSPPSVRPLPLSLASAKPEVKPPVYRYQELGVDRAFLQVPVRDFVRYRQLAFEHDHAVAVSAAAASLMALMEDFPTATLSFVVRKSRPPLPSPTVTAAAHELLLALRAAYKSSISTPKWPRHQATLTAGGGASNRGMRANNKRGAHAVEAQGRRNNGRNPSSSSSSTQHGRRDNNRRGRNSGGEPSSRSVSFSRPSKSRRQDTVSGVDGRSSLAGGATPGTRSQAQESSGPRQTKPAPEQNEFSWDLQAKKTSRQAVASLEDESSATAAVATSWSDDI